MKPNERIYKEYHEDIAKGYEIKKEMEDKKIAEIEEWIYQQKRIPRLKAKIKRASRVIQSSPPAKMIRKYAGPPGKMIMKYAGFLLRTPPPQPVSPPVWNARMYDPSTGLTHDDLTHLGRAEVARPKSPLRVPVPPGTYDVTRGSEEPFFMNWARGGF
jgi:hypothetical protein